MMIFANDSVIIYILHPNVFRELGLQDFKHSRLETVQVLLDIRWKPAVQLILYKAKQEIATSSGKLLSGDDDRPISLTH